MMNLSRLKEVFRAAHIYLFLAALSVPHVSFADPSGGELRNPINAKNIQDLLGLVMNIISILVLPFAIFFLVRTGFYFVTAGGSEDKLTKARADFLYVVIGLAIILGAQLIGAILQNTLNSLR